MEYLSRHGVHISFKTKSISQFDYSISFSRKKWKPTEVLPDICILKIGRKDVVHGRFCSGTVSTDSSKNEVYFMTRDHRHRLLIKTGDSVQEAKETADYLSKKLDKKVVLFNP